MSISYMADPEEYYVGDGDITARSLTSIAAILTKTCAYPVECFDIVVKVATSPTVTAPVIALKRTPLGGVLSAALATVTVPVGAAIGSIWRNRLDNNGLSQRFNIGDVLTLAITTAATAGTAQVWCVVRRSQQQPPALAAATYNEVAS